MSTPNYWDYLRLDPLLSLQNGFEKDEDSVSPDELHFIVVHQVYELWFKLILRSLRLARDRLAEPRLEEDLVPFVVSHLRRVSSVLELAVMHWKVVETLTPQDFLAFRHKLLPASGFQSFQMREIEILLGLEESERYLYGGTTPMAHISELGKSSPVGAAISLQLEKIRKEQTFLNALHQWLYRTPIQGSSPHDPNDEKVVDTFIEEYLTEVSRTNLEGLDRLRSVLSATPESALQERFQATISAANHFLKAEDILEPDQRTKIKRVRAAAVFIESYRDLPLLAWPRLLLDTVVEMEEQLVLFRNRHARMVERVIGRRPGTGGAGIDYLDKTLHYRVFRDLWAVRTVLLPKNHLPKLKKPEFYGFVTE